MQTYPSPELPFIEWLAVYDVLRRGDIERVRDMCVLALDRDGELNFAFLRSMASVNGVNHRAEKADDRKSDCDVQLELRHGPVDFFRGARTLDSLRLYLDGQ